jgi:hypothetical protein
MTISGSQRECVKMRFSPLIFGNHCFLWDPFTTELGSSYTPTTNQRGYPCNCTHNQIVCVGVCSFSTVCMGIFSYIVCCPQLQNYILNSFPEDHITSDYNYLIHISKITLFIYTQSDEQLDVHHIIWRASFCIYIKNFVCFSSQPSRANKGSTFVLLLSEDEWSVSSHSDWMLDPLLLPGPPEWSFGFDVHVVALGTLHSLQSELRIKFTERGGEWVGWALYMYAVVVA